MTGTQISANKNFYLILRYSLPKPCVSCSVGAMSAPDMKVVSKGK